MKNQILLLKDGAKSEFESASEGALIGYVCN